MAMGKKEGPHQPEIWIETSELARGPGHPFYGRLNEILKRHGFDAYVEGLCAKFYAERLGRPSLPPSVYFRLLLVGYFEGIDSERGIAWRLADSLTLREFTRYELTNTTPDHSTLSRNRRRIDVETHEAVFLWVLKVLAQEGLLKGETLGIDATTLEANAALRSIVRRDTGESYTAFLERLAKASGVETPTRDELAKLDRKRPKKGSNDDWKNPHDPDAKITKMKDGRTHLAHKAEHAVDMETGAVVSVTVQPADRGDTKSVATTTQQVMDTVADLLDDSETAEQLGEPLLAEMVADKGYHSNGTLREFYELGIRSYISEPDRGRRRWRDKAIEQKATYANRRRIRGTRGQRLRRRRGELLERGFAHCYDTGGMRRTHLRGHRNILKRLLVHVAGFNLGLVLRKQLGHGTPRALQGLQRRLEALLRAFIATLRVLRRFSRPDRSDSCYRWCRPAVLAAGDQVPWNGLSATGC